MGGGRKRRMWKGEGQGGENVGFKNVGHSGSSCFHCNKAWRINNKKIAPEAKMLKVKESGDGQRKERGAGRGARREGRVSTGL